MVALESSEISTKNGSLPKRHLVLTIHGIRTRGDWQDRLKKMLNGAAGETTTFDVRNYRYGFFTLFSFLVPFLRRLAVSKFYRHLIAVLEEGAFDRIDVVAHSFGTFLVVNAIAALDDTCKAKIHSVILCANVLSPDFNLTHLVGPERRVHRLINECGTKDGVLLLTLLVVGVGMGGRLGIHGFQSSSFTNRYFPFGHSDYFAPDRSDPDQFMRQWWLPLLLQDSAIATGPTRPQSPSLGERFWRTVGENGAAATSLFYGIVFTAIFGSIAFLWREAEQERFSKIQQNVSGLSAASQRLLELGKVEEAVATLKKGLRASDGLSLEDYFPDALASLTTLYAEYPLLSTIHTNSELIYAATLDKTGTRLAISAAGVGIQLWDLSSSARPNLLATYDDFAKEVMFSPDGTRLAVLSSDSTVMLFDSISGDSLGKVGSDGSLVNEVQFTRDGSRLVMAAADGSMAIHSLRDKSSKQLETQPGVIEFIAVSGRDKYIAASFDDHSFAVWDIATGRCVIRQTAHTAAVTSVAFDRQDKFLATGSIDGTTRLWTLDGRTEILKLQNPFNRAAIVGPTGRYVATGPSTYLRDVDQPVQVWDATNGASVATLVHDDGINLMAFNPEWHSNQIATASKHEIRLWSPWYGRLLRVFQTPTAAGETTSIEFSQDGSLLVSSHRDGSVRLWDVRPLPVAGVLGGQDTVEPVFLPGKGMFSVSYGGTIQSHDFPSLMLTKESRGDWRAVEMMAPQKSGRILVIEDFFNERAVQVWSYETGTKLGKCEIAGKVQSVAADSEERLAIGGDLDDPAIRICDAATGIILQTLLGHTSFVNAVAFAPDGGLLASGDLEKFVKIWDLKTGTSIATLTGHEDQVVSVAFSPDGSMLASGSLDRTARVWDVGTGELKFVLEHEDSVRSIAFHPSGALIATYVNGVIYLWNSDNGRSLGVLRGHRGSSGRVTFSPDGEYVISAASDETARVWKLPDEASLMRWIEGIESGGSLR